MKPRARTKGALRRSRPETLFVSVFVLRGEGENRRTSKRAAEGACSVGGPGEKRERLNRLQNKGVKTGCINNRRGGPFTHVSSLLLNWTCPSTITDRRRLRLIPMALISSLPIFEIQQAESGARPPSSPPVGYYDLSDLLSGTNEVNLL